MKNLKFLSLVLVAGTATLFTACTSESDNSPSAKISYENIVAAQQVPVTFGTYIGETPVTRTGTPGNINTAAKLQAPGFGVFAYYTNAASYPAVPTAPLAAPTAGNTTLSPNFMYNQLVYWDTDLDPDAWNYTPIKYWPNETQSDGSTAVDGNGATSTGGIDKLSFFAYAPYVDVTPSTGAITSHVTEDGGATEVGITALSDYNDPSDPLVSYTVASLPEHTVDLLWGVIPSSTTYTTVTGNVDLSASAGKPNLNLTKQTVSEKVDFIFKHALAKINFTVQGYFDERSLTGGAHQDPTKNVAAGTKIVVEKVDITSDFHKKGVLNLYNGTADTPNWDVTGDATKVNFSVVNASINTAIKYNSATDTYDGQSAAGVDNTPKALFNNADYFFALIPGTEDITFEITYHVFTQDTNLNGGFSKVTNVIKKKIDKLPLVAGNAYNINLQLGMTTVKVTADVADWNAGAEQYVDLPINVN